jgi:uncharacterized protein (TIGR01244 family)
MKRQRRRLRAAVVGLSVVLTNFGDPSSLEAQTEEQTVEQTVERERARMSDLISRVKVGPQIQVDDLAQLKSLGIEVVINNRPDGEVAGQPTHEDMAAAAAELGLAYYFIPVSPAGLTEDNVLATQAALTETQGPVFAYCRSGNRSGILLQAAIANAEDAEPD